MYRAAAGLLTAVVITSTAPSSAVQVTITGEWEAEVRRSGRVHLQLRQDGRRNNNWGTTFHFDELTGLDRSALSDRRTEVRFELIRDAGTVRFEGRMDDREGWGDFEFAPNPAFESAMAGYGYELTDRHVFSMAMVDISRQFVQELRGLGYEHVTRNDLISMGIHGADPEFIRAMASAGFGDLRVRDLLQFRIHGVSPAFVAEMRASGFQLDARDLVQARIHGVNPSYAQELAQVGLGDLGFRDLIQFRIHGVSAELARATREHFPEADGRDLVQMRIHGVSAGFIDEMAALGYDDVDLRDLVQFRIHGVSAAYVRGLSDAGFPEIAARDLIQMRIHGVTADFAREMHERYEDVTARDLIDARIHGRRWLRRT